ncbi:MAG: hypothetical protein ACOY3I_08345 [Verrucomicrobiota bacterium]
MSHDDYKKLPTAKKTAQDAAHFFGWLTKGGFGGAVQKKLEEYEKRMDALKKGTPLRTGDTLEHLQREYLRFGGEPFWENGHEKLTKKKSFQEKFREARATIKEVCSMNATPAQHRAADHALKFLHTQADCIWEQCKSIYRTAHDIDLDAVLIEKQKNDTQLTRGALLQPAMRENDELKHAVDFLTNIDMAVAHWEKQNSEEAYRSVQKAGSDLECIIASRKRSHSKGSGRGEQSDHHAPFKGLHERTSTHQRRFSQSY